MKNLLKKVEGNIYGMGVYCFKDGEGNVIYVGSGMMNDRLQSHLYNLKRGLYSDTNKAPIQQVYNYGELTFEVLHFSQNNSIYLNGSDSEKVSIQKALETLEQFYVNLYKDTICNKMRNISKWSTSPSQETTQRRHNANTGCKNPNNRYDEKIIANILWLKNNKYKPKQIADHYQGLIRQNYISQIGIYKWIGLEPIKPDWLDEKEAS